MKAADSAPATSEAPAPPPPALTEVIRTASENDISARIAAEFTARLAKAPDLRAQYCVVTLLDAEGSIGVFEADQTYTFLRTENGDRKRDVLLILHSSGGSIEPAYQIAKLCKAFSRERFVVAVPRQAKSAATLISVGADVIHMGVMSHLGPIDPQLGGLPALGVVQALRTLASLAHEFPRSSEMFAAYLQRVLTVEQIGYCERISESAAQYAERLLATKSGLPAAAAAVARDLVYEYKDHGFVIDIAEARAHLGTSWIHTDTPELMLAESIYSLFETSNLFLSVYRQKRLILSGDPTFPWLFDRPSPRRAT